MIFCGTEDSSDTSVPFLLLVYFPYSCGTSHPPKDLVYIWTLDSNLPHPVELLRIEIIHTRYLVQGLKNMPLFNTGWIESDS